MTVPFERSEPVDGEQDTTGNPQAVAPSGGLPSHPPTLPIQAPPVLPTQPPAGLPAHPPAGVPTRAPARPASAAGNGYQTVGALAADQLLYGTPDQFASLDDKIVEVRSWVQDYLTANKHSEDIAEARLNPSKRAEMAVLIDRLLLNYMSQKSITKGHERGIIVAAVINEILGLGPIEPLWGDPRITEVMCNGPDTVYVEIDGRLRRAPGARFRDREHLLQVCQQILAPLNRRVDQKSPLADGRLPDGSRVNIAHYVISPGGPLLTIRRFPETVWTLKDLVDNGSVNDEMARELAFLIYHKCSTVVVGGTGAGKTSLLNALSSCIPRDERIVTVEDSLELRLHPDAHVAAMEARPASASGEGEITIRDLVKNSLRMRPDRIVVGEVRDSSALDMLQAMNTGHEGSLTTVHANGADEAINRLGVLVAQGGEIPEHNVRWLIGDSVDLIVVQTRYEDGSRRVSGIYEVPSPHQSTDGQLRPIPLWEWEQTGTTEDGSKFVGQYVKHNDLSDELKRKRRLDQFQPFTMADVRRMSELPTGMQKG